MSGSKNYVLMVRHSASAGLCVLKQTKRLLRAPKPINAETTQVKMYENVNITSFDLVLFQCRFTILQMFKLLCSA